MLDTKLVRDSLLGLRVPRRFNSAWIGPFEQIVGAGYALLAAEQHGVFRRNLDHYYPRIQAKIASLLTEHFSKNQTSDQSAFDDWTSGFYFNSAIQRIEWAAERLLLTFAGIDCSCGRRTAEPSVSKGKPRFPVILQAAEDRLDHVRRDDGNHLRSTRAVRDQFMPGKQYGRSDPLASKQILAMLRYDVNNRKHNIYKPSDTLDRKSAGQGDGKTWSTSGADVQMDLACEAFVLVCSAYNELTVWNPNA